MVSRVGHAFFSYYCFVNASLMPAWQNLWGWLIKQQHRSNAGAALNSAGAQGLAPARWNENKQAVRSNHIFQTMDTWMHRRICPSAPHIQQPVPRGGSQPHHKLTVGWAVWRGRLFHHDRAVLRTILGWTGHQGVCSHMKSPHLVISPQIFKWYRREI